MREGLSSKHERHGRPVSWCSLGYNVTHLRPELKKRFPSNLKLHYTEMVGVAEKLSRRLKFKSQRTYEVEKFHRRSLGSYKPSDSWVTVHNLRQLDGGILDPDDQLLDVADDREQIIAIYDEATQPQQGDGTSASDDSENPSPDIFKNTDHKFEPFSRNGIDITGDELNGTPPLHVRRGSEPALNRLSPIPPYSVTSSDTCKRWSAAPVIEDQSPPSSTPLKDQCEEVLLYGQNPMYDGYPGERGEGSGEEKLPSSSASSSASSNHSATTTTLTKFTRDANRCSVQILSDNPSMARWAEAADRVIESTGFYGKSEVFRKEPLGGAASSPTHSRDPSLDDASRGDSCTTVVLLNDGSPLGIHVIPSTDRCGLDQGLLVEGIEPDGRVARNGTIQVHDVIIEINNKSLRNVSFHQAQEIFKDAMRDPELRLVVAMKRGGIGPVDKLVQIHEKWSNGGSKVASVASTKKAPSLSSRAQAVILHSNTRKIGKRLTVNLVKGSYGLGFSITTRDNPAGGEAPIYIKNILPRGAAIEDGHLRIGDRLLEVNGVPVTGYSQPEVAGLLRQIQVGGMASLTVSRQEKAIDSQSRGIDGAEELSSAEQCPSPTLPRQLPSEKVPEDSLMFPWKQREILTFEIPVHDSERAGLGVSVKGKTSSGPNGSIDLGIFVKNVIHGGAASRDGRLKMNDQLVNINGLSLLGKSNSEAMKTLRTAMHQEYRLRLLQSANRLSGSDPLSQVMDLPPLETHDSSSSMQQFVGPTPGMITLTVARRVDGSKSGRESVNSLSSRSLSGQNADLSGTSDVSDNTVIFNFKKDNPYERNVDGSADVDNFSINPVIQRLTGNNSNPALRNESYYKATHETWNSSQFPQSSEKERVLENTTNGFGSPTINPPPRDTVLIHDEYDTPPPAARRSSAQSTGYSEQPSQASDAYVSQSSLEENAVGGFSRDQFGRRSMSEKRHATLDAKSTDTYQRTKKAKEEREKYRQEMMVEMEANGMNRGPKNKDIVGPGLGMRKSSSLESLQTMVQEMTMEEESHRAGSGRVPRGRGCNESFRAAVDRSYDAPLASNNQMETLAEEESESSGSGFGRGNSRQSSLSSSVEDRNKKLNKKKQGIFKGLGSMFRFGKHRKSLDNPISNLAEEERMEVEGNSLTRRPRYKDDQTTLQQEQTKTASDHLHLDSNLSNISGVSLLDDDPLAQSRSERMHQLRAEHQRRHAKRNGMYPTDDSEEKYDHVLNKRMEPVPAEPKAEIEHIRSRSYDLYGDNRPGSRGGIVDPNKFSHYVNYEQIQMHLRKNKEQDRLAKLASQQYQDFREKQTSREQREYQSQRCPRENSYQQRPVSNYFEYESVQAMMSHAQDMSTASLPRKHQQHNSSRPAYPSPPPQNNKNSPSKGMTKTSSRVMYPAFAPSAHREGHYAASGFRPASQYNSMHHSSNLVPGSKV